MKTGYKIAVLVIVVWLGGAAVVSWLTVGSDHELKSDDDLIRLNGWINKNRNEYRRERAEELRKKMQDQARIAAQQEEARQVMDESLGLK